MLIPIFAQKINVPASLIAKCQVNVELDEISASIAKVFECCYGINCISPLTQTFCMSNRNISAKHTTA